MGVSALFLAGERGVSMPDENDGESRASDAAARRCRDSRRDGGATKGLAA